MKITIWSDFVCPFCYIGVTNLEQALESFEYADEVTIEYKSFQLEPGAKYETNKTYLESMMERKQVPKENIQQLINQVSEMAKSVGLNYNFDEMKLTDSYLAHRIFQYAKEENKGYEYFDKLYKAFFENGKLISDPDVLIQVGSELSLSEEKIKEIIDNKEQYKQQVDTDIFEATQVGAQGVPFFVFNNKYGVSGTQPSEVFSQVLKQVHEESKKDSAE